MIEFQIFREEPRCGLLLKKCLQLSEVRVKISGVLSALSLIRKHIWDIALAQGTLHKNLDIYMTFELQRQMTIFFDLATFYLTRGYEDF